jgi:hypothetical protein
MCRIRKARSGQYTEGFVNPDPARYRWAYSPPPQTG